MPPIIPIGPLKGIKAIDAMGTGMPKIRGPQGPSNLGDAGLPGGGMQFPNVQFPQANFPQFPGMGQPMQQDPAEMAVAAVPPQERPAVSHPKSVNGWLKYLYEDIATLAASIPATIKTVANEGYQVAKHWKYLDDIFLKHPEMLTRELDTMGAQVIKSSIENYEDGLIEALYKHPFSTLLDMAGAVSLLGGGVKSAGKVALKMGATAEQAAKIAKLGTSIESFPGRVVKAPFIGAGAVLEKVPFTKKLMQSYALSKIGREEAKALGKFLLEEKAIYERDYGIRNMFKSKIDKKDWALFDDLLDGMVPRSQIKSQAMLDRYDEWSKMVRGDEVKWAELGVLTAEEMEKAALKQTAIKLHQRGKFKGELYKYEVDPKTGESVIAGFTDEAYDAAKRWTAGDNDFKEAMRPVYKPFIHERSFNVDELLNALGSGEKSDAFRKWWSRMEQRTGMKPHVLDPDIWQARSMMQKAEIMGTVKYYDDALKRHGEVFKAGGKVKDGYVIVPPMLMKYVKNGLPNAMDRLLQNATKAVEEANFVKADRAKALKEGIKKTYDELIADAEHLLDDYKAGKDFEAGNGGTEFLIQVPKEVAYMMQKSMVGPRGFWRFYDNVLNTWRDMQLTFMPRYYVNNLLGNAVNLMFAGHTPFNKVAAMKLADLPGEAISSSLAIEMGASPSYLGRIAPSFQKPIRRFTSKMADISDNQAKQVSMGTFAKEVVQEQAHLGNVAAQGLLAMESAENIGPILFRARRELAASGLEELQLTKVVQRKTAGDFDALRSGILGKKEYTLSGQRLDPAKQSMADAVTKEMMEIQRKIQRERQLSNMSPETAQQRIAELEGQLKLKASQLEQIDPNLTIAGQMGTKVTQMPEIARMAEIQARRRALQPYADLAEKTVLQMEQFFGNYGRLHPLEREWIRRVIPFWTFSKTMFQLLFNLPFLRPKTGFLWNQFSKMMMDSIGDDRLPNRYRNMMVIGGTEKGEPLMMKIGGFNPFEAVAKRSSIGGVGIPQFIDPRNNPLVKMTVESIGGYDLFTEKPFTEKTDYVSLDGSIHRYDPDLNRIEPIIPQKPIIASLLQQVPHMAIFKDLLEAAGVGGEAIGMKSRRNPDGTLTYNRQFFHAILRAAGMPVTTENPDKVKLQHALLKRGMVKRFRSAAGRVDPTTRAQLETILRNMDQAEVFE